MAVTSGRLYKSKKLRIRFKTGFKEFKKATAFRCQIAIKQGLPNAVQARLLAADSGFAQQAAALAGQADAATRMAGVGVFPRSAVFYNRT